MLLFTWRWGNEARILGIFSSRAKMVWSRTTSARLSWLPTRNLCPCSLRTCRSKCSALVTVLYTEKLTKLSNQCHIWEGVTLRPYPFISLLITSTNRKLPISECAWTEGIEMTAPWNIYFLSEWNTVKGKGILITDLCFQRIHWFHKYIYRNDVALMNSGGWGRWGAL